MSESKKKEKHDDFEKYLKYLLDIEEFRKVIRDNRNYNQKETVNLESSNLKGMF